MKNFALFVCTVFGTLSASPETVLLSSFAEALTLLAAKQNASWPPASFAQWLKKENLISAEHTIAGLPDSITAGLYRIRVMAQKGATCNVNAWYNLAWFTLLLNAQTLQEAQHAAAMLHNPVEFEKICAPIANKLTSGFSLPGLNKDIIKELPAESKKYFPENSFEKDISSDFFSGKKLPLFYKIFVTSKRGAYGFHWYHNALGGHYIAFVAARLGNEFSLYILDSICPDGSLDVHITQYEPIARKFIEWCLNPEKIFIHDLNQIQDLVKSLAEDDDIRTNNEQLGEKTLKTIEDMITTLGAADQMIFEPSRKAYEQQRDARIAEWQKKDPTITLDTIRAIDLRKRR
jgi:hypothetical protein